MLPDLPDSEQWDDPIVAEIRAVRDAHARTFNYDLDAIFADIKRHEDELRRQGYTFVDRSKEAKQAGAAE
ncbi:MAG: hypothetical protein ABJF88_04255 [Rhodothermales bacterium]